jgi:heat-inducible transcriptional repressor
MLDDRKAAILTAVVEEYIRTASPVGSGHVAQMRELSVSSATVRNEMSVLENEGYLTQPHTSAGRIPTDKGYRFFVDSLSPGVLGAAESQQVRTFFARAHGALEQMLADTSRLLSTVTDYAAVVVGPMAEATHIRSAQLVGLGGRVALLVVVLSNGSIEKRSVELPVDTTDTTVSAASVHLAAGLSGNLWGSSVNLATTGEPKVDALVELALDSIREGGAADGEHVFVGGASRMAEAFDAVETIRGVLGILEQQFVVVGLISDILDRGLTVSIGTENGVGPLADCSVIVAPYEVDGEAAGSVGILGPTRMHYDQALAAVAVVSKRLGQALTEGV